MPTKTYLNFDLLLHEGDDAYVARVLASPAGPASARFVLPDAVYESAVRLADAGRTIYAAGTPDEIRRAVHEDAREFGIDLYETIFNDDVELALARSYDRVAEKGQGLRIRLQIADSVPELSDVPWEYLFSPRRNRPLALSQSTPLVRYIDVPDPPQPLSVTPPLHMLAIVSDPEDAPPLDVDWEWQQLQDALADLQSARQMTVERLSAATYAALQARLAEGPIHVIHFIGHGYFDVEWRTGGLVFEDDRRQLHKVDAAQLGPLLHDHSTLRLVFLNACEGARSDDDLFAGVAQHLVQQEVPAVIAMQFPVSDVAAITLSSTFYAKLADGLPVDAALVEARKAIFGAAGGSEWATPVLYSRSPDNRLLLLPEGDARLTIERQSWEPETLLVDGGEFTMGRTPGEGVAAEETPEHAIYLPAYRIGKYPITNREYAAFLAERAEQEQPEKTGWFLREPPPGKEDHPVTGVTWHDAMAYCGWLSGMTGRRYRLPTEAEWEKAARGADCRLYPWGDVWDETCANANSAGTTPVDAHLQGRSPYNVMDLAGNAQEWTQTLWGDDNQANRYPYPYRSDDGRERVTLDGGFIRDYRIHRGGSFMDEPEQLYATQRGYSQSSSALVWRGFRVVMEITDHASH